MNKVIAPAPVRRSVTVEASVERAFEVFTAQFGRWWPRSHTIGRTPMQTARIEPKAGGRWYEIGEDGSECPWGDVLAWEPPSRILLAWRIGPDWRFDPKLLTEVEVRFVRVAAERTTVELEHRLLENMGDGAAAAQAAYDSEGGWSGILGGFVEAVRQA